jgi:hypothetical protein
MKAPKFDEAAIMKASSKSPSLGSVLDLSIPRGNTKPDAQAYILHSFS